MNERMNKWKPNGEGIEELVDRKTTGTNQQGDARKTSPSVDLSSSHVFLHNGDFDLCNQKSFSIDRRICLQAGGRYHMETICKTTDDSEERTGQKNPRRVDQRRPLAEGTFDLS